MSFTKSISCSWFSEQWLQPILHLCLIHHLTACRWRGKMSSCRCDEPFLTPALDGVCTKIQSLLSQTRNFYPCGWGRWQWSGRQAMMLVQITPVYIGNIYKREFLGEVSWFYQSPTLQMYINMDLWIFDNFVRISGTSLISSLPIAYLEKHFIREETFDFMFCSIPNYHRNIFCWQTVFVI